MQGATQPKWGWQTRKTSVELLTVRCSAWLGGVIHSEQTDRVIVVAFVTVTLWQCRHRVNGTEARPLIGGNGSAIATGGPHEERQKP